MFSKFTEEAQKVLVGAKREMMELKHPYIGSEHLLLSILKNNTNSVAQKLKEFHLTYSLFREEVIQTLGIGQEKSEWFLYTPLLKRILESSMLEAKENNEDEVTVEHLFFALLEEGEGVAIRILLGMGMDLDAFYTSFSTFTLKNSHHKKLLMDDYGIDFNEKARKKELDPVVGREEELQRLIEILSRRGKNNPLLIGEAGVGKTAIVEELARKIVMGQVPNALKGKRILSLSVSSLVAGTKYRGEFEERINRILKEVEENPDVILFVDEFHTLMGAGGAEGAIDASNILKPILARGKIHLIGATTTAEYKKYIEVDKAFVRRFQPILVEEPNDSKTLEILRKLCPLYESFHHVQVSDSLLEEIVRLSGQYLFDRKQPDKAIDILDEVCAKVSLQEDQDSMKLRGLQESLVSLLEEKNECIVLQKYEEAIAISEKEKRIEDKVHRLERKLAHSPVPKEVTKEVLYSFIQEKTHIPVFSFAFSSSSFLQSLETKLKEVVLGQDQVIQELCLETKRRYFGFVESKKPVSYLFVGPTGVGKTQLVKTYASLLVGKDSFIRLDMSEFHEPHSISKIIGSPPGYVGYSDHGCVLEQVKTHPYAVLLLDEIEKASSNVLQLFLQALDEGHMQMSNGEKVRFDHVSIFMTSNIGCHKEEIGFQTKQASSVLTKVKDFLSPEFLNRIQHTFLFAPITHEIALAIVDMELNKAMRFYQQKGISLVVSDSVREQIVANANYIEYGARKIPYFIHQRLDPIVIDALLEGKKHLRLKSLT